MNLSNDLDTLFQDMGVWCMWNDSGFLGLLDAPDEVIQMQISAAYALTVKSTDAAPINHGEIITIDGINYRVKAKKKLDDGFLTQIMVAQP